MHFGRGRFRFCANLKRMRRSFFRGCFGSVGRFFLFSIFLAGASAQQCATPAETFLNQRLAVWQQRLNLTDWQVSIVMFSSGQLKPGTLGNIRWDLATRNATIHVLRAEDYRKDCPDMLADMEFTVVHELIHLELASLPRSGASRRVEEHAVNRIADALLKLDRGK